jgi:hypothetical protein
VILKKSVGKVWTGFIWFRIETRGWFFWKRQWIFGSHKMRDISLLHNDVSPCKISGFCHVVGEVWALWGCYVAYVGSCLPTFRESLLVSSSTAKQSRLGPWKQLLRNNPEARIPPVSASQAGLCSTELDYVNSQTPILS